MSNLRTLKPFRKGDDPRRNTKGRPKGSFTELNSLTKAIIKEIDREVDLGGEKITVQELIIRKIVQKALRGDVRAVEFLWNRTEGKPFRQKPPEEEKELLTEEQMVMVKKALDGMFKS